MKNNWKEIRSWIVANPDGTNEKFTLYKNPAGDFKIENDFGNVSIDMERMSGYKFLKKVVEEIENTMGHDLNKSLSDDWFDNIFDDDSEDFTNCDHTD